MKISFKNLCLFGNQNTVHLSDLNVIYGKNDIGKSTLNKLIYSLIKCSSISKEFNLYNEFDNNLVEFFNSLKFLIKYIYKIDPNLYKEKKIKAKKVFNNDFNLIKEFDIFMKSKDNTNNITDEFFTDEYIFFDENIKNENEMLFSLNYILSMIQYIEEKISEINYKNNKLLLKKYFEPLQNLYNILISDVNTERYFRILSLRLKQQKNLKEVFIILNTCYNWIIENKNDLDIKKTLLSLTVPSFTKSMFNNDVKSKITSTDLVTNVFYDDNDISFEYHYVNNNYNDNLDVIIKKNNYEISDVTYCENLIETFNYFLTNKFSFENYKSSRSINELRFKNSNMIDSNKIYNINSPEIDLLQKLDPNSIIKNIKNESFDLNDELISYFSDKNEVDLIIEKIVNITNFDHSFMRRKNNGLFLSRRNYEINALSLSKGVITFQALILMLKSGVFKKNSVVILDEVENFLNPLWQHKIVEIFFEICEKLNCKIILSSHSPSLLTSIDIKKNKYKNVNINYIYIDKENDSEFSKVIESNNNIVIGSNINDVMNFIEEENINDF
ncbi:AAA family ATPase [Spiroplasma turonicum]|uniref:ATPase AAA-type core domain-containing protein n=1 Tax=Spiroplasma turonicum TaxID=216946 RepID=A0A0K1P7H9_9MOLU|nr:AAA family ATPase [Spiroplasma turonicum]AKU79862.1 hypothetical protein STURON_00616 [Spiroplasma turonicum]ALX70877.1 hypothetical protein STURO_v1c06140 [Spiroplasma turonicum]